MTTLVTIAAIILVAFIVTICRGQSASYAAMAIAGFNALFPMFAKMLTNAEAHGSEGSKQASLYIKIAFFRWVNTAVVISIITVSFSLYYTHCKQIRKVSFLLRSQFN